MAWVLSMVMIRSTESQFGRASSGPTSLRHRVTGSRHTRRTVARRGRPIGCRTSYEYAEGCCRLTGLPAFKIRDLIEHRDRIAILHIPNLHSAGVSASEVLYDNNGSGDLHRSLVVVNQEFRIARKHRLLELLIPGKAGPDHDRAAPSVTHTNAESE